MNKKHIFKSLYLTISFLVISNFTLAQITFIELTGIENPLDSIDLGTHSTPSFSDIDRDGDLDFIGGSTTGKFNFFENDGNNTFLEITGSNNIFNGIDVGSWSTACFSDVNRDGNLDLIAGEFDGVFNYYENDGNSSFIEKTGTDNPFNGLDVGSISGAVFVDLDRDGDLDLISGEQNSGTFHYFENDGTSVFTKRTGADNPFNGLTAANRSRLKLIDLDIDGDLDLISGSEDGDFYYFQNDGTNTFTEQIGADNPFNGFDVNYNSYPTFADLDRDGDLDMISGSSDGTFYYYENQQVSLDFSTIVFQEQTGIDNPFDGFDVGKFSSPCLEDIDRDGDLDLISGDSLETAYLHFYENSGTNTFLEQTGSDNPFAITGTHYRLSPSIADIDRDGDLDVFAGDQFQITRYLQNDGTGAYTYISNAVNPISEISLSASHLRISFADLDRDGDIDAIAGSSLGSHVYFQNDGNNVFATVSLVADNLTFGIEVPSSSSPVFVDLDRDGDLDLVTGARDGMIYYFDNDGENNFTEQTGANNPFDGIDVGGYSYPYFKDLDRDGDQDIIIGAEDGKFYYYTNGSSETITKIFNDIKDNNNPLTIYPNPSNDVISIVYPKEANPLAEIRITDLNGNIIMSIHESPNEIDISTLEKGIYILKTGAYSIKVIKE